MEKIHCLRSISLLHSRLVITLIMGSLFFLKVYSQDVPGPNKEEEAYARSSFEKVEKSNRYIDALNSLQEIEKLPVGQVREINGQVYVIVIDKAYAKTGQAFVSAYFRFNFPGTTEELIFGAKDIAFNPGGFGLSNNTKLILLNDKNIPFNEHLNLILSGGGDNYIEWGCDGFKSVHLQGDFEFDPGWITPVDEGQDKVKVSVTIQANDLTNILAAVTIPPFKIAGLNDFSFSVTHAVVDMSDRANPPGLTVTGDMAPMPDNVLSWRGFYLGELEVGLPSQLSTARGRPKVSVRNFYIDDQGVSGEVVADKVVEIGEASAGGWPLSITQLSLSFSRNRLNGGGFEGLIGIAFLGDEPLNYRASVNMRNEDTYYDFSLVTNEDKTYQFFAGEITVGSNSRIAMAKNQSGFSASATLNGKVSLKKGALNIAQINYQDLTLSSQSPYVHSGTFDFVGNGNSKVANFPVGIDDLKLGFSDGKVGIGGTVRLNFMNSSDKGFAATASFLVTTSRREETQTIRVNEAEVQETITRWEAGKVTIGAISLNVTVAAFTMEGSLSLFENHAVYGNGFRGNLAFSIPGPIPTGARASAYFGSKDGYRYWHADVYVGTHIPLPTPVTPVMFLTGLMGGLSYHMSRPAEFDTYRKRDETDKAGGLQNEVEVFEYIPNEEAGLGFMAGVSIQTAAVGSILNANAALEIEFSTGGGLRNILFAGSGYVMRTPEKANSLGDANKKISAPVWVTLRMNYNRPARTFDALLKTYVDAYGALKGSGPNGLVGEAALHIGEEEWYFYIGRPSQMFSLKIFGLADVNTYFMMGTRLEDMPPPPSEVNSILGKLATKTATAENVMTEGRGLGFGAHFRTGFSFDYFVYGEFAVGAGADIQLRNLGENARCKGGSGPLGVNGWYASGQAYAFLSGDVGIRVKVLGKKRSFRIAALAAAVLLEAKLPNPSWFMGQAGVRYSVLGGLIKGSAGIKVELGTKCEIVGGRELEMQVISDIKPDNNSREVSVFATPQVSFNMPVEKPFEMLNNQDQVARYRIKLSQFTIKDNKNVVLQGTLTMNAEGTAASFTTRDILPSVTTLTALAGIVIEKQEGGQWRPLSGTAEDYETKSTVFTTGEAPNYIPWENVAYTYPVKRQYNFLPREHSNGYIKLKQGQPYLFETIDNKGKRWAVQSSFEPAAGVPAESNVSYDGDQLQVNFSIPENLTKETIYKFSIVRTSLEGESADSNVQSSEKTTYAPTDTTTIRETSLKGVAASGAGKEVIAIPLRTSMYGTFKEKMEGVTGVHNVWDVIVSSKARVIGQSFETKETFDKLELEGESSLLTKSLIELKAGAENSWLKNQIMPLLYTGYPFASSITIDGSYPEFRDAPSPVPLYAINLYNNDNTSYDLGSTAVAGGASSHSGYCRFIYYLVHVATRDFGVLRNKASRYYLQDNSIAAVNRLITTNALPDLVRGLYYPVELQYRLPGSNQITSTVIRQIYYR